jgi:ankyrin repeat protein
MKPSILSDDSIILIFEKVNNKDISFLRLVDSRFDWISLVTKRQGEKKYPCLVSSVPRFIFGLNSFISSMCFIIQKGKYLANIIAEYGTLEVMKYARANIPRFKFYTQTCAFAAGRGDLEMLKYLRGEGCLWNESTCEYAAKSGHLEVLKYVHENGLKFNAVTFINAVRNNHLDVLKYLVTDMRLNDRGTYATVGLCTLAAANGNIKMIKYLRKNNYVCTGDGDNACVSAAKNGQLECLKFLMCDRGMVSDEISTAAANQGHFEVLKYLCDSGRPISPNISSDIIKSHCPESVKIEMIEYMRDHGYGPDAYSINISVKQGNFEVLKYLYGQVNRDGHILAGDSVTCEFAARLGHIDILKYLIEKGCGIDRFCCDQAVKGGNIEILKYLREIGCKWNSNVCYAAALNGHLDILRYIRESDPELPWHPDVCGIAAINGHIEILRYAHENGCPWSEDVCTFAAKKGNLDILKYAYKNGCNINIETCLKVAKNRCRQNIVDYLHRIKHNS